MNHEPFELERRIRALVVEDLIEYMNFVAQRLSIDVATIAARAEDIQRQKSARAAERIMTSVESMRGFLESEHEALVTTISEERRESESRHASRA